MAAMPQVARHPSGGGTRGKTNRFVVLNQLRGSNPDVSLFAHELLFAVLKCCVVTEGCIKEFLHQRGPTAGALHQPFAFESGQVPPDTWTGSRKRRDQLLYA